MSLSIKQLSSLFAKEYVRFLSIYQLCEFGSMAEESCEDGETCCAEDYCEDEECELGEEEENDSDEESEDGLDFDPYEYALLFSAVRLSSYAQEMIINFYKNKTGIETNNAEEVFNWLQNNKAFKNQEQSDAAAYFINLHYEISTVLPQDDLISFSQDEDRLPLVTAGQLHEVVEHVANLVQWLQKQV